MAPQVQQAYGGKPRSVTGTVETYYVSVLALAFVVILVEGLFVAVSVRIDSLVISTSLDLHGSLPWQIFFRCIMTLPFKEKSVLCAGLSS